MFRYFIYIAYDGTNYHGWQIQPNGISVQETIMKALYTFLRKEVKVVGAGRTDAGVHALEMAAHFDLDEQMDEEVLTDRMNRILPADISVLCTKRVTDEAHSRFDALSRTYYYYISHRKYPFSRKYSYRVHQPLNYAAMNEAAKILFEYEDFTSFSKLHTDTKTNNCKITKAIWEQMDAHTWRFTIQADRFLRNMVRAIVGTLLEVGRGKMNLAQFREVIESKDRGVAGASVPGEALFLAQVEYPDSLFLS